jgi:hypothetical protein
VCSEVEVTSDHDEEFHPGSLIPGGTWVKTAEEPRADKRPWLAFSDGASLRHNVVLLKLPAEASAGHLLSESQATYSDARLPDLRARLDEVCRMLTSEPDALDHKGTFRGFRSERTMCTTRHPGDRRLVGLHLDTLQSEPVATLHRATSRLCLNLGPNPRWFVFLPLDVDAVIDACGLGETDVLYSRHFRQTVVQRAHPPVSRVRLDPGEAYIAPTQLMLHDGQSDSRDGEYLYTVLGFFDQTGEAQRLSAV